MKKIVDMDEWYRYYKEVMQFYDEQYQYDNGYRNATDNIDDWLEAQPDAEEKHGKWEWFEEWSPSTPECPKEINDCGWRCGECKTALEDVVGGYWDDFFTNPKIPYCPNCGAKMDLGEEEALLDVNLLKKTKQQFLNENNIPESAAVWLDVFCEIFKKNIDKEK